MNCCLCGEKISMFGNSNSVYFADNNIGTVCEKCYANFYNVKYYQNGTTVDELEESCKYFIDCTQKTQWDSKFSNHMLAILSKANSVVETEKSYREKFFPDESTKQFGEEFIINQETSYFSILEDGFIKKPHSFNELIDYEVREDGNSVTSGKAGKAVIGTLLAGTAGAIIGSAGSRTTKKTIDELKIILIYKEFEVEPEYITLVSRTIDRESDAYKNAISTCDQIVAVLKKILQVNESEDNQNKKVPARAIYAFSVADEIRKFKELKDENIITEEEFQKQKTKLLNLDY